MRFLLPLPTQREQRTGREGGHIAPIDCWGGLVANRRARRMRLSCENPKLDHATSLETEVWQTMDALIYGSFHKTGERTISSHSIWLNCKGPSETQRTEPKKKEGRKNFTLFETHVKNWTERLTLGFCPSLNSVPQISTFPIICNFISHGTFAGWKNIIFYIIEMKNGLELNSIIYSNLQTNKSNIAQGQNAFYVSKSKTKEQAIKRSPTFHSIQYFWATSSKTLWWSECGLETSFSCRAPSLDLGGQSQSGSSCLWLFPGSPACRHVSTSPVSSPTQDVAFAFQEFPETGKKKWIGFHVGVIWCEKRNVIKYCCFVYLTQFYKPAALWLMPICGCEDVGACGERAAHRENRFYEG